MQHIEPDAKVMQSDFCCQARLKAIQRMRTLTGKTKDIEQLVVGRFNNLTQPSQPAPPVFRPAHFAVLVWRTDHLGIELLKVKTDTYAVHIPYASSPLAVLAILQGDVQFACVPAVAVMPQVKSGKLRPLAVSTAKRSALTPEIPTMKEAGLPEIENMAWMAVMAPASTPTEIVERLNKEINAALLEPDVKEKLASQFMEPVGGSADDLRNFMKRELTVMTPIIKRSGATAD